MATNKSTNSASGKIVPLGDRVLVKVTSEEVQKTDTGIYIPETADKKKQGQGTVIAVGEGRITEEGKKLPMHVKVGDTIVFSEYAGETVTIDGEEYYIVGEGSILAVIK